LSFLRSISAAIWSVVRYLPEQSLRMMAFDNSGARRGFSLAGLAISRSHGSVSGVPVSRDEADGARDEAGGARDEAGDVRDEAGGARDEADGVRDEAGGVRDEAGSARDEADGVKVHCTLGRIRFAPGRVAQLERMVSWASR
jgi:hypothetical protein